MGFKFGIIGLPNVGKSTLFNALTNLTRATENFPFCTIEPNIGIVNIPDFRLYKLSEIVKPKKILHSTIKFIDIAGLVKGASKGEGLGNKFLENIREVDAIGHVVRCFKNDNIIHILEDINPIRDIDIINTELILSDIEVCDKIIFKIKKIKKIFDNKDLELSVLNKCQFHLNNIGALRTIKLTKEEENVIHTIKFLTKKPMMYIANIDNNCIKNNSYLYDIKNIAIRDRSKVISVCASLASKISKLKKEERDKFLIDLDIKYEETGINQIINYGFNILNLNTYFTVGVKEVRAWTIKIGTTALKAAGKIHSDIEKGFIRAKIISFENFILYKGEKEAKKAGKIRYEGKNYIVKDGDIIHFLFKI